MKMTHATFNFYNKILQDHMQVNRIVSWGSLRDAVNASCNIPKNFIIVRSVLNEAIKKGQLKRTEDLTQEEYEVIA